MRFFVIKFVKQKNALSVIKLMLYGWSVWSERLVWYQYN